MQNDFAIQNVIKRSYATHKIKARHHRRLTRKPRRYWYNQGRTEDWWVRLLSGKLSDESWRKNFRMDKGTLRGLNFAGIKIRGSSNPRSLDISLGFNFADNLKTIFFAGLNFADEEGSQIIFFARKE